MSADVVLSARRVTFRYPAAVGPPALDDVDVAVRAGRTLRVLGANGSGRTTLLAVLAGLAPAATGGSLTGDVRGTRGAAFVHADPYLNLSGARDTVRAELAFGLECRRVPRQAMIDRVRAALDAFALSALADRDPTTLSGGEAARLAVACQWVLNPAVLLVDEVDAQLDAAGAGAMRDLLAGHAARGGATAWAGARFHDGRVDGSPAAQIRDDDALVLDGGRIVAAGPAHVVAAQATAKDWGVGPRRGRSLGEALDRTREWTLDRALDRTLRPAFVRRHADGGAQIELDDAHLVAALAPVAEAVLDVDGLVCRFTGDGPPVLDDVSCRAAPGEVVAVVGPNGGGKSTLGRAIAGLHAPAAGTVRIGGRDAAERVGPSRGVALMVQRPERMLFRGTVADEVAVGLRWCGVAPDTAAAAVAASLAACGLADRATEQPHDLPPSTRRWLALAATVALGTPVVVLDEPTAGFDDRDLARFAGLVATLRAAGRSVVWVTHDHALARVLADRAVRLVAGRVAASGRADAVIDGALDLDREVTNVATRDTAPDAVATGDTARDAVTATDAPRG